ncbi:MAG: phosphotransferase [Rothia sp. (in: high G+C Gram-positive bacteria)]|uniref:phosphotransferase n=1 Tax=Rothia sp. (in: high G+C Gram-positive bacteria) TaxID=1885016 RepID=UPI0026E01438|nr:phosphotransferase [Rothia sp. (in: high G+C Gram-positive bacteria)]MDO5750412.1 phosphotransferase [Rothia sp. (in: high G+C Gram-positive bacteria)]
MMENLPHSVKELIGDRDWTDMSCHSQATVYALGEDLFLKIGAKGSLQAEANMTALLAQENLAVQVLLYLSEDKDYLLTEAARGQTLTTLTDNPDLLCHLYGRALRQLHDRQLHDHQLSAELSPQHTEYLELYKKFNIEHATEREYLLERYPLPASIKDAPPCELSANIFIHGDACLPNILHDARTITFIDWGQAGFGDAAIDLYWAIWSLAYNLHTEEYTDLFLASYGWDRVDEEKIAWISWLSALPEG